MNRSQSISKHMDFTGERMVPESADLDTFWEHLYRYRFARRFVRGRKVVDVACGEGYGAYSLLEAGAASVLGIDVAEDACAHARDRYGIDTRCASGTAMPIPDATIDVVVSFETLEHISEPSLFVKECSRILIPDGVLVISTPNRNAYSVHGQHNPFHCAEMDEQEFLGLLRGAFQDVCVYSQCLLTARMLSLRSLAARTSGWSRLRGFWRLRNLLCSSAPWVADGANWRSRVCDAMAIKESRLSTVFNPYVPRKRAHWTQEKPMYFLAVCRGPLPCAGRSR